jgi:hypothetical protein
LRFTISTSRPRSLREGHIVKKFFVALLGVVVFLTAGAAFGR